MEAREKLRPGDEVIYRCGTQRRTGVATSRPYAYPDYSGCYTSWEWECMIKLNGDDKEQSISLRLLEKLDRRK